MAELQFPNIVGGFLQGRQIGQAEVDRADQQQRRSRLSELASLAYAAPTAEAQRDAIGKSIGIDADAGLALSKGLQAEQDRRQKTLLNTARYLLAVPEAQRAATYQQILPTLRRDAPQLPWKDVYDDEVGKGAAAYVQAYGVDDSSGLPTGFRELDLTARSAGYQPGTPEYQRFFRVAGGTEGRAPSGGFSFDTIKGADGRERPVRRNPRTGVAEVYDERVQDFVPLGGAGHLGPSMGEQPAPSRGMPNVVPGGAEPAPVAGAPTGTIRIDGASEAENATILSAVKAMESAGVPRGQIDAFIGEQGARYNRTPAAGIPAPALRAGLGVSTTAAEDAFAKRIAEDQAALANYDAMTDAITRRETATTAARKTAEQDAEHTGKQTQRAIDAQATLDLLNQAEVLLPNATGSVAGTARDQALGAVGISTQGAQAIAQLNLIASQLVSKVPRFEGPQSNIDVQFYREAAGDLANPNLPVATRQAALREMRRLNQKYADQAAVPAGSPAAGTGNRIRYDAQGNRLP